MPDKEASPDELWADLADLAKQGGTVLCTLNSLVP